ncbi:MAG TPA: hypothetical protein VG028_07785 [Terriglobia bacterium]|nr:hypothetical protein [Terriglobia bacterium]
MPKPDYFCEQEASVLEAVESGRWPQACDEELRAHVAGCSICADVLLVAQTLQQENQWARTDVALPAAGLIWWKAQMRAKREAAMRAAAPIAMVEKAAGIFGVLSLVALAIWRWDLVANWLAWLADLPHSAAFRPGSLWNSGIITAVQNFGFLMILSAAACLLLASVVLYFTLSKD